MRAFLRAYGEADDNLRPTTDPRGCHMTRACSARSFRARDDPCKVWRARHQCIGSLPQKGGWARSLVEEISAHQHLMTRYETEDPATSSSADRRFSLVNGKRPMGLSSRETMMGENEFGLSVAKSIRTEARSGGAALVCLLVARPPHFRRASRISRGKL